MNRHHKSLRRYHLVALLMVMAMLLTPLSGIASAQSVASSAWGSGTLTDDNLRALIAQMTVDEKDTFIHGSNTTQTPCATEYVSPWVQGCQGEAGRIPGVPTLGIPALRLADGPAGVRLGHVETAMPAPVGLTATFDRSLAHLFGATVGRGQRATNQDVWLAPMMNIVNIPTGGRNFETLGEDAYLSGEMGLQLTLGSQSEGIIATLKHYVDNDFENGRNSTTVMIDERTQYEIELAPFEKSIKQGGAGAVMCSYNRIADVYACGNDLVQNKILKGEWGWDGFIMSDWGATHTPQDLIWGLDMEQSGSNNLGTPVITYVTNGTGSPEVAATNDMPYRPAFSSEVWSARLDDAVFRILKQMNKAGLLEGTQYGTQSNGCNRAADPPINCVKWIPPRADLQAIQLDEFEKAQLIAEQSATLLKNEGSLLPLSCADLTTGNGVVLMGPTAITTYTGGGGSAHVIPYDTVASSYDALIAAAKVKCGDAVKVSFVPGYDLDGPIVPSSVLKAPDPAEGYANWTLKPEDAAFANLPGLLRQQIITATVTSGTQPVLYTGADAAPDQLDATVNYIGSNGLPANTAWRWSGTLTAPAAGSYALRIFIANQSSSQLFIDGLTTSNPTTRRINLNAYPNYFPASMTSSYASLTVANKSHDLDFLDAQRGNYNVTLTEGQQLHLDLRAYASAAKPLRIQFRWVSTTNAADQIAIAAAAAGAANKTLVFAYNEGTEGSDRGGNAIGNGLALAGNQADVIAAVAAASPNTGVVLNTGDPVFMPWAANVKSILQMWYPGQMGGPATANVVLGNVNPGGKSPVTFPDATAPIGQRFPQDTQLAACADGTANYGTASSGPGNTNPDRKVPNPGECPLYPGIYQPGFLWNEATGQLHSYRTINYSDQIFAGVQGNGIFQGYRWFDKNDYAPLFPFGHGLSYTTFDYSGLKVAPAGDGLDVSFMVKNTGSVAGAEVPQVYVGKYALTPVPMAEKALAGFERIELAPGESKQVMIHVGEREMSYWSVDVHDWVMPSTFRPVYVGSSSRDIRLEKLTHAWSEFFPPVGKNNMRESRAGQAIPLKFSLNGAYGMGAVEPGYPMFQPTDCKTGAAIGTGFSTASSDGLQYVDGQYVYVWKTDRSWGGTCGRLDILLNDGQTHSATFSFK